MRAYARFVGVLLILLGVVGMLGVGTTNPLVDLAHLLVGGLFAYTGFKEHDERGVRETVGVLGAGMLAAGIVLFLMEELLWSGPLLPNGVGLFMVVFMAVGVLSLLVVFGSSLRSAW